MESSSQASSQAKVAVSELELVERVFLKIVGADTDEKLQSCLNTFLTPLLLKLGSPDERVKNKVIELLTHINKRVKSRPKILLPVDTLLKQYEDEGTHKFVTNFTLIYIRMGVSRISKEDQVKLIPKIFKSMKGKPKQQQEMLLLIVIPGLNELVIPEDVEAKKRIVVFYDDPSLCKVILDFMMDFLFLPYSNEASNNSNSSAGNNASLNIPPGLSKNAMERLKFDPPLDTVQIEQAKLGIIKILGSHLIPAVDVLCHFIVASADSRNSVSDKAEHCIKRFSSPDDWEQQQVVNKLFLIFQGTVVAPGNATQALKKDDARSPASLRLKLKIFPFLLRSRKAADCNTGASIKIIFESLFGDVTNNRLRTFAIQYCHHMCQFSSDKTISFASPLLYQAFIKVCNNKKEEVKLRGLSYTGLGKLVKRAGNIFRRDIALVQKLFGVLEEEGKEVRLSVQEALSMIAPAYKGITGTDASLMESLILSNLEKESSQTRLAALQLANAVFDVTHVPSRYACLLSCTDAKDDVREEARRGLNPVQDEAKDGTEGIGEYPDFSEICDYLHVKITAKISGKKDGFPVLPTPIFEQVLSYLRLCLHASANITKQQSMTGDTLQSVATYITTLLTGVEDVSLSCIGRYVAILKFAMVPTAGASLHAIALEGVLEVVAASTEKLSPIFLSELKDFKSFMQSPKEEARIHSARLISILLNSATNSVFVEVFKEMLAEVNSKVPEVSHGAILGLAYTISRQFTAQDISDARTVDDSEDECSSDDDVTNLTRMAFQSIATKLSDENISLRIASCNAIGEISKCMPMPLGICKKLVADEMPEKKLRTDNGAELSKELITDKLISFLTDADDTKTKERAACSLGYILIGEPAFPYRKKIVNTLCSTARARLLELNFTVGEALSCAGAGALSLIAKDKWTLNTHEHVIEVNNELMLSVLETIISNFVYSSAGFNRQAATIWLLSIIKYSSTHSVVQEKLEDIQSCFMDLLSTNDEITQDVASRGISLVYEQVEEEKKDELVSLLVERITTGKRPKTKVDENTELFGRGQLGASPEGGNLSTYKELCSLASSLNKPDLVYKFMNLANHNAIWNSRKGAAFGFLSIASQAGKQLEPFLPQLIPKLYRYQYDPNPDVRRSMLSIWSALVPDGKKSLDKYTKEIIADLLANMTNFTWRTRESSCSAMGDLIKSAPAEDFIDDLPKIWEATFKVLDDIKESVRKAATMCGISISKVTIRVCDVSLSKVGEKAVTSVLPVLLNIGLASRAETVKTLSLGTLAEISKSAGKFLKPHIPELTIALLESLSGLEPQYLNELNLQLTRSQDAQEKLDAIRVSALKSSPMMETINKCVQYVDADILNEVVPSLSALIKTGIGLGTKVGCANFIISLTLQCRNDLLPYSGKLLAVLLNGLGVTNNTVKKAYANAIGHLVKYSKESSVEKLVLKLKDRYLEQEDQSKQLSVAWTFQAISRHSHDALASHASIILPVVFLARHQQEKQDADNDAMKNAKEIWEEVWNNSTPGTQSGIKLYLNEIFETVSPVLSSQSWTLKSQAAQSIGAVADSLGTSLTQPYLGGFLSSLLKATPGRIWDGKEQVLKSLSSICVNCRDEIEKSFLSSTPCPEINQIVDAMMNECKKSNLQYKIKALNSTSFIIEKYQLNRFLEMKDIVHKYIQNEKENGIERDHSQFTGEVNKDEVIVCCLDSLGRCWPVESDHQSIHIQYVIDLFTELLNSSVWKVQTAILRFIEIVFKRLNWSLASTEWKYNNDERSTVISERIFDVLIPEICSCIETTTHASVKLQAFKCIKIPPQHITDCSGGEDARKSLVDVIKTISMQHKESTNFEISQIVNDILSYLTTVAPKLDNNCA
eukprot:gene8163-9036_t